MCGVVMATISQGAYLSVAAIATVNKDREVELQQVQKEGGGRVEGCELNSYILPPHTGLGVGCIITVLNGRALTFSRTPYNSHAGRQSSSAHGTECGGGGK